MNIMNFTQPNFNISWQLKANKDSILSLNQTNFEESYMQQIHKVPQSLRKSNKQGKLRKNYFRSFIMEKERYKQAELNKSTESPQQKPKQFLVNARKIKNFGVSSKDQITFDDFVKTERQSKKIFLNEIRKKLVKQAQRSVYLNAKKSLEKNRKLSPLKRGSLIVEKKYPKKQLKITFLNIQKVPLQNMYQRVNEQSEDVKQKKINFSEAWNLSNIQTNFDRQSPKREDKLQQFSSNTKFAMTGGFGQFQPRKRKPISQDLGFGTTLIKFKKFNPPFERYHYRDFIWKVAYSNSILLQCSKQIEKKFKVFIGRGNNSLLVKSLMKRRSSWWTFTERYEQAHFIWTQIKINDIFKKQSHSDAKSSEILDSSQLPLNFDQIKKRNTYLGNRKILNDQLLCRFQEYFTKNIKLEQKLDGTMSKRNKVMKKYSLQKLDNENIKIHNHLPNNYIIGNKKALFYTMTAYYQKMKVDPFEYLPQTYHIQNGLEDPQYTKFLSSFYPRQKKANKEERQNSPEKHRTKNIWIVKPGEFSNRGNGINVCLTLDEIKKILKTREKHENGNPKTFIIQSYLDKPFLYQRRKFDIRHYMMITSINGKIKGYWYELGYIRTTSYEYNVKTGLSSIHLTNDAVQKNLPDYGKYQKGNKLTYGEFQVYLEKEYGGKYNFFEQIYPKMKKIATDAIRASSLVIDPERKLHNFEVFGLDFMIDQNFKPWLIEINNNPCLELSCPHLTDIIPAMVENAMKIAVDSLIPPPATFQEKRPKFSDNVFEANKFELVYDSDLEQGQIRRLLNGQKISQKMKQLDDEMDEVFQDDGKQLQD